MPGFGLGGNASGVTLNPDLAIIDSRDGFNCCGPDGSNIEVDGTAVFSKTLDNFDSPTAGTVLTTLVYGLSLAVDGWGDCGHSMALSLGNPGAGSHSMELFASGAGWQGGDDESFAVDGILMVGSVVPAPAPVR